jgi:hypothetical protein
MAVSTPHRDELLIAEMREPPPLEQARASLDYWMRRRASLSLYKRSARREADEMIRRCRQRVAEAERRRYGTGIAGFVRRLIAGDTPQRLVVRSGLLAFAWAFLPRRLVYAATAFFLVWLLVGVLVVAGLIQLLN